MKNRIVNFLLAVLIAGGFWVLVKRKPVSESLNSSLHTFRLDFPEGEWTLRVDQDAEKTEMILQFLKAGVLKEKISVPSPSSQRVATDDLELEKVEVEEGAPPSVVFTVGGGGDGNWTKFSYVFSLVEDHVIRTFHFESESDSYFNVASCTYIKDGFFWEEIGQKVGEASKPVQELPLIKSPIHWNSARQEFQKGNAEIETAWIESEVTIKVYSKPSLKAYSRELPAKVKVEVLRYQVCDPKEKLPFCDPGIAGEMPRWYEIVMRDRTHAWLLRTDESQIGTNLKCSL